MPLQIPKVNSGELRILLLLSKRKMHVRALREELNDYGSVSKYLRHLEALGFISRERRKGRVWNMLTPKGRRAARALASLRP